MKFSSRLKQMGACRDAVNWSKGQTQREAWDNCPYGVWLIDFIAVVSGVQMRFYSGAWTFAENWVGRKRHDIGRRLLKAHTARGTGLKPADRIRAAVSFEEVEKQYKKYLRRI